MKAKLIRITTVPVSFNLLLRHQLSFMKEHYDVIAVSSPGDELAELAARESVTTVPVSMTRSITPLQDLKALWQLYRLFRKEKPGIVHTHTPKAGLLGMTAAWLARVPVRLHTVAGMPLLKTSGSKRVLLNFIERCTYSFAHQIYPNSFELGKIIIRHRYCPPSKLKVIGKGSSNGIDTSYFSPGSVTESRKQALRQELALAPGARVFCFSGRIVADKGINELVAAFTRLINEFPDVRLVLVGWKEDHLDPLKGATADSINNHPAITWVGYQSDIRPYLAISHALVFPSYREGFPNVPMQAGAMGLPCIVSDINGCNEIVLHERNGLLVPPKDVEALYLAMRLLLTDSGLYSRLAANAREMITGRFDQLFIWQCILEEYREQILKSAN